MWVFQNISTLQLHSEGKTVITSFNRIFKISFGDSTFDVVSFRLVIPLLNLSWCTMSFSIARLACALCTIFSSIVFWVISRNITTGRVWPIRWHRSMKKKRKYQFWKIWWSKIVPKLNTKQHQANSKQKHVKNPN